MKLKREVLRANLELNRAGLAPLTWGNVSGIDRKRGLMAIKPSGVDYAEMGVDDIVLVDLDGKVVGGKLKPSCDTPTHLALYKAWPEIGGVVHAHSCYATAFAQACRTIPCLGTTHADLFPGPAPLSRPLTKKEIESGYEWSTGQVIVGTFAGRQYMESPAVLAAHHGPFAWGMDPAGALKNAIALEEVARMAWLTLQMRPDAPLLPGHYLQKHYTRKHGPNATYGQGKGH